MNKGAGRARASLCVVESEGLERNGSSIPPETESAGLPQGTRSRPVPWALINFWLDTVLLVAFLLLTWISGVVHLVFPAGPGGFGWSVFGYTLTDWRNFQFVTLCGLGLGLVVHVMLHWSWVCGLVRTRFLGRPGRDLAGADTLWGVGFLIALLHLVGGGLLAAWVWKSPL